MPRFIMMKLGGPMQSWGGHTYEDWRPTELFPTRSALLGLLGACLGVDRNDTIRQSALADSVRFAVISEFSDADESLQPVRLCDYHTIQHARKVDGQSNKFPVQSYRWYLYDALFSVAIEQLQGAPLQLESIAEALRTPIFTPFLGRRSCPLGRPLLDSPGTPGAQPFVAQSAIDAFVRCGVAGRAIYHESAPDGNPNILRVRDVPMYGRSRQFATRDVYMTVLEEVNHVHD